MNKIYSLVILLGFTLTSAAFELTPELKETGLKTIIVETIDDEEPTCESIEHPAGSWGVGITNVNKVPGSVVVMDCEGNALFDSGEYTKKESGMTIKVRGNTSALKDKKPYKIKLEKKGDLLCRGDKNLRDKNWALLSNLSNLYELGFLVSEWIGMPWTPAGEYVNLVMNGSYRGLYFLVEAVERNETCRIITDETGFIAERDPYWWNQDGEYLPSGWNTYFNWTMKYPDFEDLTDDTRAYVQSVLDSFEAIIKTENYEELIDIDSFCRWLIAQDILGSSDGGGTNFYLAKFDNTPSSKLYVPVLWDVDSAEETEDRWSSVHNEGNIKPLFENTNTAFKRRYVNLYWEYSPTIFDNMEKLSAEMRTEKWEGFNKAAQLNNTVWNQQDANRQNTALQNADDMDWWFPARRRWLDNAVADLETTLGMNSITSADEEDGHATVFTLSGITVYEGPADEFRAPAPGIYLIRKGGKTVKTVIGH